MTDAVDTARREELARKIVRVHALRDPLGAKGQRRTGERVGRESRARRGLFAAALTSFVACFGIVALSADEPEETGAAAAGPAIVAEVPLDDGRGTIVRILQPPPPPAPETHVRTRAS
jgi:hypothetical protein